MDAASGATVNPYWSKWVDTIMKAPVDPGLAGLRNTLIIFDEGGDEPFGYLKASGVVVRGTAGITRRQALGIRHAVWAWVNKNYPFLKRIVINRDSKKHGDIGVIMFRMLQKLFPKAIMDTNMTVDSAEEKFWAPFIAQRTGLVHAAFAQKEQEEFLEWIATQAGVTDRAITTPIDRADFLKWHSDPFKASEATVPQVLTQVPAVVPSASSAFSVPGPAAAAQPSTLPMQAAAAAAASPALAQGQTNPAPPPSSSDPARRTAKPTALGFLPPPPPLEQQVPLLQQQQAPAPAPAPAAPINPYRSLWTDAIRNAPFEKDLGSLAAALSFVPDTPQPPMKQIALGIREALWRWLANDHYAQVTTIEWSDLSDKMKRELTEFFPRAVLPDHSAEGAMHNYWWRLRELRFPKGKYRDEELCADEVARYVAWCERNNLKGLDGLTTEQVMKDIGKWIPDAMQASYEARKKEQIVPPPPQQQQPSQTVPAQVQQQPAPLVYTPLPVRSQQQQQQAPAPAAAVVDPFDSPYLAKILHTPFDAQLDQLEASLFEAGAPFHHGLFSGEIRPNNALFPSLTVQQYLGIRWAVWYWLGSRLKALSVVPVHSDRTPGTGPTPRMMALFQVLFPESILFHPKAPAASLDPVYFWYWLVRARSAAAEDKEIGEREVKSFAGWYYKEDMLGPTAQELADLAAEFFRRFNMEIFLPPEPTYQQQVVVPSVPVVKQEHEGARPARSHASSIAVSFAHDIQKAPAAPKNHSSPPAADVNALAAAMVAMLCVG